MSVQPGTTKKIGKLEVMTEDLGKMSWTDATKACRELGEGWRLPTREELTTLYENKDVIGGFAVGVYDAYLSSTIYATNSSWVRSFADGKEDTDYTGSDNNRARAVRTVR